MKISEQELTFIFLDSGNKLIDAAYFIKMMFQMKYLTDEEIEKVLEFVKPIKK